MSIAVWKKGRVREIIPEAPGTNRFFIEVPELKSFDFEPGQFVTLDLPIGERNAQRWRSYSIASAPDGTNMFELIIVKSAHGKGTEYLFEDLSAGSEILLRGPQGKFTLPEIIDKDLYLICTGTGIAPFRSMIRHIYAKGLAHRNVHLVFGCRHRKDLLYRSEWVELSGKHPDFHYHPTLSREDWVGHKGYVHAVYRELLVERPPATFFLCGWKDMIHEARVTLAGLGYDKSDIHFELYG
jgi:ferredoxin-NADP reductase